MLQLFRAIYVLIHRDFLWALHAKISLTSNEGLWHRKIEFPGAEKYKCSAILISSHLFLVLFFNIFLK